MTATETRSANIALFSLWALFWVATTIVALQEASRNEYIRWWEPLLWEGSSALLGTLWLLLQRRIGLNYAQYLDRPRLWFLHHLKWLPLFAPVFVVSIYGIRNVVYGLVGRVYHHDSWTFIWVYETVKLLLFLSLWLGVIFGFDSFAQWRSQRERLLNVQKALAESQLQQLQSQLRPHFLFNALNTISSLMHVDLARADRLLARLGDLLRLSLQVTRRDLTSLREELRMLELYAQIMQERFVDRVSVSWDIAADTADAAVPALLLQPLLENAFRHGVERSASAAAISIASRREDGQLVLTIVNTGTLDSAQQGNGIGLRNCRERLRVHYGADASLELREDGGQVIARVRLPYREYTP